MIVSPQLHGLLWQHFNARISVQHVVLTSVATFRILVTQSITLDAGMVKLLVVYRVPKDCYLMNNGMHVFLKENTKLKDSKERYQSENYMWGIFH